MVNFAADFELLTKAIDYGKLAALGGALTVQQECALILSGDLQQYTVTFLQQSKRSYFCSS